MHPYPGYGKLSPSPFGEERTSARLNDESLRQQLEKTGALDPASLEQAMQHARSRRRPLAEAIVELGFLAETVVYKEGVAKIASLPFVDLERAQIPPQIRRGRRDVRSQ